MVRAYDESIGLSTDSSELIFGEFLFEWDDLALIWGRGWPRLLKC